MAKFGITFDATEVDEPDCFCAEFYVGDSRLKYYGTVECLHSMDLGGSTIAYAYVDVDGDTVWKAEPWEADLRTEPHIYEAVQEAYKTFRTGILRSITEEEWLEEVERRGNVIES